MRSNFRVDSSGRIDSIRNAVARRLKIAADRNLRGEVEKAASALRLVEEYKGTTSDEELTSLKSDLESVMGSPLFSRRRSESKRNGSALSVEGETIRTSGTPKASSRQSSRPATGKKPVDEWARVVIQQDQSDLDTKKAEEARRARLKVEMRKILDMQVEDHKKADEAAAKQKLEEAEKLQKEVDLYAMEIKEKKEKAKKQHAQQRRHHEVSITEFRDQKAQKDAAKRDIDAREIREIQAELEKEQKKLQSQKAEERAQMTIVIEENLQREELKREKAEKIMIEDIKMMKQQEEMLELQERRRMEQLNKTYERQAKIQTLGSKTQAAVDVKAQENERRALAARKVKEAKDETESRAKATMHQKKLKEMNDALAQQVEEKRLREQRERDEHNRLAAHMRQAAEQDEMREKRDLAEYRSKLKTHQAGLVEQMNAKEYRQQHARGMTAEERRINSNLLGSKVADDADDLSDA